MVFFYFLMAVAHLPVEGEIEVKSYMRRKMNKEYCHAGTIRRNQDH